MLPRVQFKQLAIGKTHASGQGETFSLFTGVLYKCPPATQRRGIVRNTLYQSDIHPHGNVCFESCTVCMERAYVYRKEKLTFRAL